MFLQGKDYDLKERIKGAAAELRAEEISGGCKTSAGFSG